MRAPKTPLRALRDGVRAQQTFGAGNVANAGPIPEWSSAVADAMDGVSGGSLTAFHNEDIFDLASAGAQDLDLTYLPVDGSEHVEISGLKTRKGVHWSRSDQTLSLLAACDARVGEVVTVEYAYLDGMPTHAAASVSSSDPIAYYRMDETSGTILVDSSGNGRDGTYSGSPTLGSAPLITTGTSVTFDSTNYASVPAADIPALGDQMSFEMWVATSSAAASLNFFGSDNDVERALQFRFTAGVPEVIFHIGGSSVTVTGPSAKNDGDPHQCTATYDGTTIRLYVDGTQVASTGASGDINENPTLPWCIGSRHPTTGGNNGWEGRVDEVAIYDYPLTATQVHDHYIAGTT